MTPTTILLPRRGVSAIEEGNVKIGQFMQSIFRFFDDLSSFGLHTHILARVAYLQTARRCNPEQNPFTQTLELPGPNSKNKHTNFELGKTEAIY